MATWSFTNCLKLRSKPTLKLNRRGEVMNGCQCHSVGGDPHTFDDDLECIHCGKTWRANQSGGVECTTPHREEYDGGRDGSTG